MVSIPLLNKAIPTKDVVKVKNEYPITSLNDNFFPPPSYRNKYGVCILGWTASGMFWGFLHVIAGIKPKEKTLIRMGIFLGIIWTFIFLIMPK